MIHPDTPGFAHFELRGKSLLLPGVSPLGYPHRTVRLARLEDNQHANQFAPLIAASPDLANMLCTLVLAYSHGTDTELAQAIHKSETLLTTLSHPLTAIGGPINPLDKFYR
jgi:hypothetical protein